jgi:hypothetical protein
LLIEEYPKAKLNPYLVRVEFGNNPVKSLEQKSLMNKQMLKDESLMNKQMLKDALSYWDQAGERPYEVLIENGLDKFFSAQLEISTYMIKDKIYRGTSRHSQLEIGDTLDYRYPTSWSTNFENACNFVDGVDTPVILMLSSVSLIKAIENTENTYKENEVIVSPIILSVIKKYQKKNLTILEVIEK